MYERTSRLVWILSRCQTFESSAFEGAPKQCVRNYTPVLPRFLRSSRRHLDPMCVVHEPGRGFRLQLLDRRSVRASGERVTATSGSAIEPETVFADLAGVSPSRLGQRSHRPVIDHENVGPTEFRQMEAETAVSACQSKIAEQRRRAGVQRRVAVEARLLRQHAGDEALAGRQSAPE